MKGQWAPVQSLLELVDDHQAIANDMVVELPSREDERPFRVVRGPVQFNGEALETYRAPQCAEHTEAVLLELGMEWEKIAHFKSLGAIA